MNKKIIPIIIAVLLLITGIIAVTQESPFDADDAYDSDEIFFTEEDSEDINNYYSGSNLPKPVPNWVKPVRWFRSNKGGMAIEEIPSRLTALRHEYALAILFAEADILPEYLIPFYNDDYYIEIRTLYEDGEQIRTQWIFKDINARVRLTAVFMESDEIEETFYDNVMDIFDEFEKMEEILDLVNVEGIEDINDVLEMAEIRDLIDIENEQFIKEEIIAQMKSNAHENININGFMEIYDENSFLTSEYRFINDGAKTKTEFNFNDNLLLSAVFYEWVNNENGEGFNKVYEDFYRYNRSYYLRGIERKYYQDNVIAFDKEPAILSFPLIVMGSEQFNLFIGDRLNPYPEFFGIYEIKRSNRMVYTADERGRILNQTLYDEEDNVIWVIYNAWSGERIIMTTKIEDETELIAEYEYNAAGDRIIERNKRNGSLERVVTTDGKMDIEELYLNDVVVLRAVWDDGRKVSETRVTR